MYAEANIYSRAPPTTQVDPHANRVANKDMLDYSTYNLTETSIKPLKVAMTVNNEELVMEVDMREISVNNQQGDLWSFVVGWQEISLTRVRYKHFALTVESS